jgi:DNA repair photolyase
MNTLNKKILAGQKAKNIRGRGAADNPPNRFEAQAYEQIEVPEDDPQAGPTTQFYHDRSKSILSYNDSPDVGFSVSFNPYRGCEHGCIYCYARPSHEYLGMSAGLDFETKIFVKAEAPQLLRRELMAKKYHPQVIAVSGVTDCYQPAERHFRLTRRCLEVLNEFRNPASIITKNHLVTRDLDVLKKMAEWEGVLVNLSVTTLDPELARILEPRASTPRHKLEALEQLSEAGIPVGVMVAPVIPALTESEIPAILHAVARAGARRAGYVMLRLPYGVAPLFEQWLERHYPERKDKILHHLREIRGGKLNQPEFGARMVGQGPYAEQISQLFEVSARKAGLNRVPLRLNSEEFKRVEKQLGLF